MEWWKLFSGTFILIFLAELGDKTQLAAMAKTADAPDGSMAKWVVFLAASLALATSTFIAVFLGHVLKSVVPDERYIRLAAAVLFLLFGATILYETVSSFRRDGAKAAVSTREAEGAKEVEGSGEEVGVMRGLALRAAMDFEELSRNRYRRLASSAGADLSALLMDISREEDSHLAHLREFGSEECGDAVWNCEVGVGGKGSGISGRAISMSTADKKTLAALVEHEEATAAFYRDLAARTLIPSVRSTLNHLASEEDSHAARLREFA